MTRLNFLILLVLFASISCQKPTDFQPTQPKHPNSHLEEFEIAEQSLSTFIFEDLDGRPLADADVLFGTSIHDPFPNNFLKTDANGQIEITSKFSNLPITISAPNYIRTTFFGINSGSQKFQIRPVFTNMMIQLKGKTTDYGSLRRDNIADFGVVIQGISREDLMAFDMNMLISPEKDTITIEDQKVDVPSNVSFPKQTENYVIPISFEKSSYRFFVPTKGQRKIYALHGQFPFKEVINEMRRHAPFSALINYFKFVGGNLKDANVDGITPQDISVNSIIFNKKVQINTLAVPADKTMVLISAAEVESRLYPADLKKIEGSARTATLNSAPMGTQYLVAALKRSEDFYAKKPTEFGLSATLIRASETEISTQPPFMDIIETPTVDLDAWKVKDIPKTQNAVNELATYAVLSQINKNTKQKSLIWEAYAPHWVDQMNLPLWPDHFASPQASQKNIFNSWEVSFLGTTNSVSNINLGPEVIGATTHVSYNKKEFQ
jgi:hypothetical protein